LSITIKDVAQKAGCSIKTVSRVVNQEPHVKPYLRDRVIAAIEELGYAPNISARRLVQNRAYVITILLHSAGSFQSALLSKVLDVGYEGEYDILVQTYYPSFSRSRNKLATLIQGKRIDGLVTTPPCDSDPFLVNLLKNSGLPHVHISPLNPTGGKPYVAAEDFTGAHQMTEYLLNKGHRRIGFLTGPRNHRASIDRLYGYQAALNKAGLDMNPALVLDSENNFPGGYTATRILMDYPKPPTAIFASSDEAAAGSVFALNEIGFKVPDDVSVCAFGNYGLSEQVWPGISVVNYPLEEIVEQAVKMLIEIVEKGKAGTKQIILPTELLMRNSIAANKTT
jgi:LacI family transcriptional regulator